MQVRGLIDGHIVVDDNVDTLKVDTTAEELGREKDARLEVLKVLEALVTLSLLELGVDEGGGEVGTLEDLGKGTAARNRLDENNDLVKVKHVEDVHKLGNLVALINVDVVLDQGIEGELGGVINEDLKRIVLHKLLGDLASVSGEGSREHHDLLVVRSLTEGFLHLLAHISSFQELVALVKNKELDVLQAEGSLVGKGSNAARSTDDDVRSVGLQELLLGGNIKTSDDHFDANGGSSEVLLKALKLLLDLDRQFAGVSHHDSADLTIDGSDLMQDRQDEDGGLTHTRLGLADNVLAVDGGRNSLLLN